MRTRLVPVLLLGCVPAAAAAEVSPFRAALAAEGGCGRHWVLAADRLGSLDGGALPRSDAGADADLFGKPAGSWSEAEIRDAGAVFAACEARAPGIRADPGLPRRFEAALRRAVALARAREPAAETPGGAAPQRAGEGSGRAAPDRGGGGPRQGPAFIPAAAGAPARDPGQQAAEVFREEERVERAGDAVAPPAVPAAVRAGPPDAVPAGAGPSPGSGRAARLTLSAALGAPRGAAFAPDSGEPKPAIGLNCAVSLRSFELLQAEMRMPEVESLLGCRGASDGTATIPGLGAFETFSWSDRGGTFTVTLVFQGQRLKSKAQRGLN